MGVELSEHVFGMGFGLLGGIGKYNAFMNSGKDES